MNRKETKKLTDKYKKYESDIFSEDKQNQKLQLLVSLEGLKVIEPKQTPPNLEEILANMENRINFNMVNMMANMENRINSNMIKMEDRINSSMINLKTELKSDIVGINSKIDNLRTEMNNRFDKLELRVATLESFHQADFIKN